MPRWERRRAFLLGLTGAAGALDALAFLTLGKVFTSFQSGNVLFLGLGLGRGDWGLVLRAGAVLVAFVIGTAAGAHVIGARLQPRGVAIEVRVVAAEVVLLLVFAGLWLALGDPGGDRFWRIVLLVVAASAMGIQAALSLALKIPNVLTVALTATVANLGQRLGLRAGEDDPDPDRPPTALLATLVATYAVCA
ncbi:MAG TPA: DUF1275 family protein, partial [Baekduia sp.]|nr:DUF1275 family protein [Baekduia sp.]